MTTASSSASQWRTDGERGVEEGREGTGSTYQGWNEASLVKNMIWGVFSHLISTNLTTCVPMYRLYVTWKLMMLVINEWSTSEGLCLCVFYWTQPLTELCMFHKQTDEALKHCQDIFTSVLAASVHFTFCLNAQSRFSVYCLASNFNFAVLYTLISQSKSKAWNYTLILPHLTDTDLCLWFEFQQASVCIHLFM